MPRQFNSPTRFPAVLLLMAAALVACDTADTTQPVAPPPPPTPPAEPVVVKLVITQPLMTIEVGIVSAFFVLALDENNRSVTRPPLQWTSDNPAVATVSEGFVTGVGQGMAVITVTAGATLSATGTVTVWRPVPTQIRLSSSELILGIGDSEKIQAQVFGTFGRVLQNPVKWTSENPAIASVSDSGVVTAKGVGTAKIVAVSEPVRAEAEVLVGGPNFQAQWATAARASSQYEADSWAATQALGQLNVLTCNDESRAWASAGLGVEWLELDFAHPVQPTGILIYEVWSPGSIVKVEVKDMTGKYHQVYSASPQPVGNCLRRLHIPVTNVAKLISTVRITVDQTAARDWNEIDAVRLLGYRP